MEDKNFEKLTYDILKKIARTESPKDKPYKVTKQDILVDLKIILKDYYLAFLTEKEDCLKIAFSNGQVFYLSVAGDGNAN